MQVILQKGVRKSFLIVYRLKFIKPNGEINHHSSWYAAKSYLFESYRGWLPQGEPIYEEHLGQLGY